MLYFDWSQILYSSLYNKIILIINKLVTPIRLLNLDVVYIEEKNTNIVCPALFLYRFEIWTRYV